MTVSVISDAVSGRGTSEESSAGVVASQRVARAPTPGAFERFPRVRLRGDQSAGIAPRIGSAQRSAGAPSPAVSVGVPESAPSSPICPGQAIQSRLVRNSGSIPTRAQDLVKRHQPCVPADGGFQKFGVVP